MSRSRSNWATALMTFMVIFPAELVRSTPPRARQCKAKLDKALYAQCRATNERAANDVVVKAMDEMELPNFYLREAETLYTASDGQKFEVRGESLHARRSFKYFGQGQGVSAYTFVDERHFLWHSLMISAADRESAYVIDGLMHDVGAHQHAWRIRFL